MKNKSILFVYSGTYIQIHMCTHISSQHMYTCLCNPVLQYDVINTFDIVVVVVAVVNVVVVVIGLFALIRQRFGVCDNNIMRLSFTNPESPVVFLFLIF